MHGRNLLGRLFLQLASDSVSLFPCWNSAEEAIGQLWDKEDTELKFDFTAAVFSLLIKSIGILSRSGWTTEELVDEVYNHSEADDNVCEHCGERFNDPTIDHDHSDDEDDD